MSGFDRPALIGTFVAVEETENEGEYDAFDVLDDRVVAPGSNTDSE